MALNPPITPAGVPLRVEQEYFVLYRKDMECEVKIENMGKYTAYGKIYLTTCRMVFVNDKFQKDSFKSFDFPLAYLNKEKFEQPIFGSNYLQGEVAPLYNLLPGKTQFKLWFKAGGCSLFLKLIVELLKQIRQNRQRGQVGPDQRWVDQVTRTQSQAYMDPNDPSVIYVAQPGLNQQMCAQTQWNYPKQESNVVQGVPYAQPQQQQPQPQYQQPQQQPQYQQPQQQQPYQQYQQPNQYQPSPFQSTDSQYQNQPLYQQPIQPVNYPDLNNQQINQSNYSQQSNNSNMNYPPPPQSNQNYPPPPESNQNFQPNQNYPPPSQQNQNYPPPPPQQNQNYPPPQGNQVVPQNGPPNQPNAGYYYGFWGPQLQNNQQNNNRL